MLFFAPPLPLHIGEYYTDNTPGLAFFTTAKSSMLLRIYWFDSKRKGYGGYKDFIASNPEFGPSAPNGAYHRVDWSVDGKRLSFEWKRTAGGADVRLESTRPEKMIAWLAKGWPGSKLNVQLNPWGYRLRFGGPTLVLTTNGSLLGPPKNVGQNLETLGYGQEVSLAPVVFHVAPGNPGLISIAPSRESTDLSGIPARMDAARLVYRESRAKASGDWGDFVAPIQNELGHSRVFSCDTGRISEIVSRGWCLPDGQVLFCWDSFFNGLLASIESPSAGRDTVRAILAAQQPSGLVPNFAGRGWGVSADRSQPPVGSLCVWKMYERDPDRAFLREVYPKLLKWHRWWFTARDGNRDGLLEWGSATGVLQNAKFESGLDDSPMFDTGSMEGPHMALDSVDLSSLWAMDAEYLAKIAAVIGHNREAARLRSQARAIGARINNRLWNSQVGAYCYRYWAPRAPRHEIAIEGLLSAHGQPGLAGQYYEGRNFGRLVGSRQDRALDFDWSDHGPIDGLGNSNYSVRWAGQFTPESSGPYIFKTSADDGVRVWFDGRQIIDDWGVHGTDQTDSKALQLMAGKSYPIRVEYFQAEGGAVIKLAVDLVATGGPADVFYKRLSPLNFYPMAAGIPDSARAQKMRDMMFRSDKFEGEYVCPTISRDDPAFPHQGYWRGTIWGPTNYLLYQGFRRYATNAELNEFSRKSVALFMKNWNANGTCHENFNGMTGVGGGDAHYTWGALLCLIGIENLCDIEPNGKLRLNGDSGSRIEISHFRLGGKLYDLRVRPHEAELLRKGHVVYRAMGKAREWAFSLR